MVVIQISIQPWILPYFAATCLPHSTGCYSLNKFMSVTDGYHTIQFIELHDIMNPEYLLEPRFIVHSAHATRFMLQKSDAGSDVTQ